MTHTFLVLAQVGPGSINMLFMLGMVVVMYFFMLRPQIKKQKEQKAFSANIAVGETIITIGGVYGKITRINPDGTIQIEADRSSFMTIEASAISMEMTTAMQKRNATAVKP